MAYRKTKNYSNEFGVRLGTAWGKPAANAIAALGLKAIGIYPTD
jgi:hypothetical protein